MNLELLEEIHQLQEKEVSDADIASSIGMSKSSMMICLRMEKIFSDKYEETVAENKRLISFKNSYLKQIEKLKNDLHKKDEKINLLQSTKKEDYLDEMDFLRDELKEKEELSRDYYNLLNELDKYNNISNFIKKIFLS